MDILLIIHIFITVSLIGIVLLQRSSQDGFGMGSGGGHAFMSSRATGNFLTRLTAILATLFMANSLLLAYLASHSSREGSGIIEQLKQEKPTEKTTAPLTPSEPKGAEKPALPVAD